MCCKVDFLKRHTICLNELHNVVLPVLTYARVKSVITIVPTEWVAFLTRIRELWVSEHCSKTDYSERVFLCGIILCLQSVPEYSPKFGHIHSSTHLCSIGILPVVTPPHLFWLQRGML